MSTMSHSLVTLAFQSELILRILPCMSLFWIFFPLVIMPMSHISAELDVNPSLKLAESLKGLPVSVTLGVSKLGKWLFLVLTCNKIVLHLIIVYLILALFNVFFINFAICKIVAYCWGQFDNPVYFCFCVSLALECRPA